MKRSKLIATALLAGACYLAYAAGFELYGPHGKLVLRHAPTLKSKGKPSAPLWIVEYMDYTCHSCARSAQVLRQSMERYPGEIYLQVRFHPFRSNENSLTAAVYAECASRQFTFWPYHELLLERQADWAALAEPQARQHFGNYAQELAMDAGKLSVCVEDPRIKESINKEYQESVELKVTSTPTFFINGQRAVGDTQLVQQLGEYFDKKGLS